MRADLTMVDAALEDGVSVFLERTLLGCAILAVMMAAACVWKLLDLVGRR